MKRPNIWTVNSEHLFTFIHIILLVLQYSQPNSINEIVRRCGLQNYNLAYTKEKHCYNILHCELRLTELYAKCKVKKTL